MNYEQLRIFISVVDNGGFTKAALVLGTSHSKTSRQVAALEEALGVCLLERNSRSAKLTSAGELLYNNGKALLKQTDELEQAVIKTGETAQGKLAVACAPMRSASFDRIYREFCRLNPAVIPVVYRRGLSDIAGLVRKGSADIGVSFSYALGNTAELDMQVLERAKFCAVVSQDHPLAEGKSVFLHQLRNYCYITVGEARSEFTKQLEDRVLRDRSPSEILYVPTLESLFMQLRSGKGVSLVPEPLAQEFCQGCCFVQIEEECAFDVVMFSRSDNGNPAVKQFVNLSR